MRSACLVRTRFILNNFSEIGLGVPGPPGPPPSATSLFSSLPLLVAAAKLTVLTYSRPKLYMVIFWVKFGGE